MVTRITYWPFAAVLREHFGVLDNDPADVVTEGLGPIYLLGGLLTTRRATFRGKDIEILEGRCLFVLHPLKCLSRCLHERARPEGAVSTAIAGQLRGPCSHALWCRLRSGPPGPSRGPCPSGPQ